MAAAAAVAILAAAVPLSATAGMPCDLRRQKAGVSVSCAGRAYQSLPWQEIVLWLKDGGSGALSIDASYSLGSGLLLQDLAAFLPELAPAALSLDLSHSALPLERQEIKRLLSQVQASPRLRGLTLRMAGVAARPRDFQQLARGLGNLSNLVNLTLDLSGVAASGTTSPEFMELGLGLGRLERLESLELRLESNGVTDADAWHLRAGLGRLSKLSSLTVSLVGNRLQDLGARELGVALGRVAKLRTVALDLGYNSLGPAGADDLAAGLRRLGLLESLRLSVRHNSIGPRGVTGLVVGLSEAEHLAHLELDASYTRGRDAASATVGLGPAVGRLGGLTALRLDLTGNGAADSDARELAAGLEQLGRCESPEVLGIDLPGQDSGATEVPEAAATAGSQPFLSTRPPAVPPASPASTAAPPAQGGEAVSVVDDVPGNLSANVTVAEAELPAATGADPFVLVWFATFGAMAVILGLAAIIFLALSKARDHAGESVREFPGSTNLAEAGLTGADAETERE